MENIFGKALLEAREMTGTSREDLSARTRMCVDTIKKYESEDANPNCFSKHWTYSCISSL